MDFSEEQVDQLVEAFKGLGVKPKTDSAEDLKAWMAGMVAAGGIGAHTVTTPSPMHFPSSHSIDRSASPIGAHTPYSIHIPKIAFFSGGPKETDYDLWKFEVQGLLNDHLYSHEQILQAIRRSVKGDAARILVNMGHEVSVNDILHKLDACFGMVLEGQSILAEFYNAPQKVGEDVAYFANRLESLIHTAVRLGKVASNSVNEMLVSALQAGGIT